MNLVPFLINSDITNNPPISLCHTAAGNFTGDWVRCPASYLYESGPLDNCTKLFQVEWEENSIIRVYMDIGESLYHSLTGLKNSSTNSSDSNYNYSDLNQFEDYITFCINEDYFQHVKYVVASITTLIGLSFFPYLVDYYNHPDSFTGPGKLKKTYKKLTSLLSKNHEIVYLKHEHSYAQSLIDHLYLGRIPPNDQQKESFTLANQRMKELSGLSILQWSIRESYYHLSRYVAMRYDAEIGKEEWQEACQKGWVEFVEMLVSTKLPKVQQQDKVSLVVRLLYFNYNPIQFPALRIEFTASLEKFLASAVKNKEQMVADFDWIKLLFSRENVWLINAFKDEESEMGEFLRFIFGFVKTYIDSEVIQMLESVDDEVEESEDKKATVQDIYELQTYGPDPVEVCERFGLMEASWPWKMESHQDNGDNLSCCQCNCIQRWSCKSFCFCCSSNTTDYK